MALAHDLLQNGVMDFIIAEDDQHQRLKLLDDMLSSMQGSNSSA